LGEIVIPFKPRPWQAEVDDQAQRFNVWVLHRRAGKTVLAVNRLIRKAVSAPPMAICCYIAPQYRQAKRVAWEMLKHYAGVIPGVEFNASELLMTLPNGSRTYLLGATDPAPIRGSGVYHAACDEIAQWPRVAWEEVLRPALSDWGGTADFIGTPMGMANLFYELYSRAGQTPGWTKTLKTVHDTGTIAAAEIEQLKREMSEAAFSQEYECDWSAAVKGAYYGNEMSAAEKDGRVARIPYDPALPVDTAWDIGVADSTVVLFLQALRTGEVRLIDCKAYQNTGLPDIKKDLDQLPYSYGTHYAPHDIKVREWGGSGQSRLETARQLGIRYRVVPNKSVRDGIEAVRVLLPRMWFDRENCFDCIEALKTYRASYDDVREVYSLTPLHTWESHYCDALRAFAVGRKEGMEDRIDYSRQRRALI
jgi:phage terminase large subunit